MLEALAVPRLHRRTTQVGPQVRARRIAAGLSQAELAHRIGAADATVSRLERGKFSASERMLEAISTALHCTVADLYTRAEAPPQAPAVRPAQARLLSVTEKMTDAEIEDVVRAIHILIRVGQRTSALR